MVNLIHLIRNKISSFVLLKKIYLSLFKLVPVHYAYSLNRSLRTPYSQLEDDNSIIFIHIPKAAGNALIKSLYGRSATGHDPLSRYMDYDKAKFERSYKFAVVRNPWDRMVSSFYYLKQGGIGFFDTDFADKFLSGCENFDSFVHRINSDSAFKESVMSWVHFVPQVDFLMIDGSSGYMDQIIKLEELNEGYERLRTNLQREDTQLIKDNQSSRSKYQDYYTEETIQIVKALYSDDIALLDYVFGDDN
jgi:chondroitin 4-sulfotransferase 11